MQVIWHERELINARAWMKVRNIQPASIHQLAER
jgi:hypothetical protein